MKREIKSSPGNGTPSTSTEGNAFYCHETTGCDTRLPMDGNVTIRSLTELRTKSTVLIRDAYFEGGDVLRCYEGRFRFRLEDRQDIEIGAGEALVIYPNQRVSIEALGEINFLRYAIFDGDGVSGYFDRFGFFDGLHGITTEQLETFDRIKKRFAVESGKMSPDVFSWLSDALTTYAHDFRENGNALLIDAIRQIRENLKRRIVRLDPLYEQMGISHTYLHRIFARAGIGNPSAFIRREQLRMVIRRLKSTDLPVSEIAEDAGFISMTHFANFIKHATGQTAGEIRRGCVKVK